MAELLSQEGVQVFLCTPDPEDAGVANVTLYGLRAVPNLPIITLRDSPEAAARQFERLGVDHLHIHNLVGYLENAADFFPRAAAAMRIEYDVTIHDYQSFCPRLHLVGVTGVYCGEPSIGSCQRCVSRLGSIAGQPVVWDWRARNARMLTGARRVFAPSQDAATRVARRFDGVHPLVREHPERSYVPPTPEAPPKRPLIDTVREPIRIGVLGALTLHKGSQVLQDVAIELQEQNPDVELLVIGHTDRDRILREIGNVRITGSYVDSELNSLIESSHLTAVWFPAVWPETYSFTLSAALACGLPIIAYDLGAVAERLRRTERGNLIEKELMLDPQATATRIVDIARAGANVVELGGPTSRKPQRYASVLSDYYELDL
jgi:glycosyltransferase involved in cell wall biosynthesis